MRLNSPAVMPPTSTVKVGINPINPKNGTTTLPANLPRTMSQSPRSVRKSKPQVPSRFSALMESAVRTMPETKAPIVPRNAIARKNMGPSAAAGSQADKTNRFQSATTMLPVAQRVRIRRLLGRRKATRSSPWTSGSRFMASIPTRIDTVPRLICMTPAALCERSSIG